MRWRCKSVPTQMEFLREKHESGIAPCVWISLNIPPDFYFCGFYSVHWQFYIMVRKRLPELCHERVIHISLQGFRATGFLLISLSWKWIINFRWKAWCSTSNFYLYDHVQPASRYTQPPVQWVSRAPSPGVLLATYAKLFPKLTMYGSLHPHYMYAFAAWCLGIG